MSEAAPIPIGTVSQPLVCEGASSFYFCDLLIITHFFEKIKGLKKRNLHNVKIGIFVLSVQLCRNAPAFGK